MSGTGGGPGRAVTGLVEAEREIPSGRLRLTGPSGLSGLLRPTGTETDDDRQRVVVVRDRPPPDRAERTVETSGALADWPPGADRADEAGRTESRR